MQSRKTHEQQVRIIEKREKTAGAHGDFDASADLKQSEGAKRAFQKGGEIHRQDEVQREDRSMVRGRDQESEHHKRRGH